MSRRRSRLHALITINYLQLLSNNTIDCDISISPLYKATIPIFKNLELLRCPKQLKVLPSSVYQLG